MGCKKKTLNKIKVTSAGLFVLIIAFFIFQKQKKNKLIEGGGEVDLDDENKDEADISEYSSGEDEEKKSLKKRFYKLKKRHSNFANPQVPKKEEVNIASEGNDDNDDQKIEKLEKRLNTLSLENLQNSPINVPKPFVFDSKTSLKDNEIKAIEDSSDDDKLNLPDTDNYLIPKKDAKKKKIDEKEVKKPVIIQVKDIHTVRKITFDWQNKPLSYKIIRFGEDLSDQNRDCGMVFGGQKSDAILSFMPNMDQEEMNFYIEQLEDKMKTHGIPIKIVSDEDYV